MAELLCRYKCQKCDTKFSREKPSMVNCLKCGHNYVDWLNSEEVLKIARSIDNKDKLC